MAKNIKDEFLTAYKQLEETLSYENLTVYEYNQQMNEKTNEAKQMQIARLVRNYLSHQSDDFILPTKEMVTFLRKQNDQIIRKHKKASDIMTRITPVSPNTKVSEAAAKLGPKKPFLVVTDTRGIVQGLFTRETIRKAVTNKNHNKTIKSAGGLENDIPYTKPDTLARNIITPVIVTSDGTKNGKYKGVIIE